MTSLLLLASLAFAGDREGIVQIPQDTQMTFPTDPDTGVVPSPWTVPHFGYFLPEPYYDEALAKSKKLDICVPALERCTDTGLEWMRRAAESQQSCLDQFGSDETRIDGLTDDLRSMETRALTAEGKVRDLRQQRNTAWAITGGLVLGAVAVTAVAIGG